VQIVQLLDERKLSFSFCLNRDEMLVQAGFGLLFQTLDLDQDGKLIKDCQRMVCSVIEMLDRNSATGAAAFSRVGCSMVSVPRANKPLPISISRHNSEGSMPAPTDTFRATQKHLKAIASRFTPSSSKHNRNGSNESSRRATLATITPSMTQHTNPSSSSLSSICSDPPHARSEPTMSPITHRTSITSSPGGSKRRPSNSNTALNHNPNLDYLSFAQDPLSAYPFSTTTPGGKVEVSPTDWERLLSSLDNGQTNIYDTIYGGPPVDGLLDVPPLSAGAEAHLAWAPGVWGLGDVGAQQPPQSVLSFSDESLTSGEDFGNCDFNNASGNENVFHGIVIPESGGGLGGLDRNYGL
jgi:hypothetical protein